VPLLIKVSVQIVVLVLVAWLSARYLGGYFHAPAFENPQRIGQHPDLSGTWQAFTSANYDIEPHDARAAMAFKPGPIKPVPHDKVVALGAVGAVPGGLGIVKGGLIPYKSKMRRKKENNQNKWLELDPEIKCYMPGIPRANYMPHPFQIFHSAGNMLFAYSFAGAVRNIFFEDPGPVPMETYMGQSVGHWEGETLVVVVTGQNDQTWLDRAGNFHSNQLKVTERYTLTGPNSMRYQATLEDPQVYTRPLEIELNLYRRLGEDAQLMQFKCVEFVEELMYGHLRKVKAK
jgi:hypothetical protein